MKTRITAALLGSLCALVAVAQTAAPYRIGYLSPETEANARPTFDAFRAGMRELGYVEGRSISIDARFADNSEERLDRQAAELVRSKPDIIVAQTRAVFALRKAEPSASVPVVFGFSGDPVLARLAESLQRPNGSFTGISMLSLELAGKRMELLKEVMPALKRVAIIANPSHAGEQAERAVSEARGRALGLALDFFPVRNPAELEAALADLQKRRCEAIIVFPDAGTMTYSRRLAQFTAQTRIPAVSGWLPFAEEGNLMTYGPELRDAFRLLAGYVDKILKGARPGALPIELPRKFELAVNLGAAKAARVQIPESVRLRADRIIEEPK